MGHDVSETEIDTANLGKTSANSVVIQLQTSGRKTNRGVDEISKYCEAGKPINFIRNARVS